MVELLPARRDVRVSQHRGEFSARLLHAHDATIIACPASRATAALQDLPDAALWQRLFEEVSRRGAVSMLTARISTAAIPAVVVLIKDGVAAFDLLTLAGRAWKELSNVTAPARLLLATVGMEDGRQRAALEALLAAALAGSAPLPTCKSQPAAAHPLSSITMLGEVASDHWQRCIAIDRGNHLARWLTMLPPNVLDSQAYRRALDILAKRQHWSLAAYDEAALKRLGAGAFLAVARANAHRNAGIVRLRYRAAQRSRATRRVTLVGKGICFDSGGINLKTHKGMYSMHEDMQGSAVAVGSLFALSELKVPFDIDCWLALTENEIGPHAYRPQEVVRAVNGVTIQVAHSDAEGRMALADTLALAARETPHLMIDFATLTGACVTALTERYSGVFTNDAKLHATIELAGRNSGERVWPFPMDADFDADLESSIADVLQCTPDSKGDHILAARFLNRFVPASIPWIHMDLAASNRSAGLAHIPTDCTGFGVRYTVHLLLDHDLPGPAATVPGAPTRRQHRITRARK